MVKEEGKSEGKVEGKLESSRLTVVKLLQETDFNDEKIANFANTEASLVRQIRQELEMQ